MKNTSKQMLEMQAGSWLQVWDLCVELGMETDSDKTGEQDVLDFIRQLYEEANT